MVHRDLLACVSPLEAGVDLEESALAQVELEQILRQLVCGLSAVVQVALLRQLLPIEAFFL